MNNFLNKTTMYRLALYYLSALLIVAVILSFLGLLPFSPFALMASATVILISCRITNYIFALIFKAPANVESVYITALILALIINPPLISNFSAGLLFLIWVSVLATAGKFIFAFRKKHIFNPAAFAVALTAITINQSASWWAGNFYMLPFVVLGGFLIVKKLLRWDLFFSFFAAAMVPILAFAILRGSDPVTILGKMLFESPILFFSFIILTEPVTTPPTRFLRVCDGILIGLAFAPQVHIGTIFSTPELALLFGNIFSFLVSPKGRLVLKLKEKKKIANETYDFLFSAERKLNFKPGQYLEWTLGHRRSDNRGVRRYFTIASSPTEKGVRLGVKFYENASTFKKSLGALEIGDEITASQLAGDFVLPKNKNRKLAFLAGGIGITPFRSIIKYLLDKNEKRDVILIYANKNAEDAVYNDIWNEAREKLGIKVVCQTGFITKEMIIREIPDFKERFFYISGPRAMVTAFEKALKNISVKRSQIKTDFFPGYV
ncbi:MAG: FAD-binding oxidoreductase [Candidatus Giovannonibacteria bacterium]|nr:FAD-binding oxidoreductase [Candidatus Giovannonibacteria bacterium]